ncbi:MAG: type II secretion system protein [Hylemonella sp.]|nr:type II secretion system protein [Hylemonella sp.]MDH5709390.1 type II secretion system protein [Hylemonella sp.]
MPTSTAGRRPNSRRRQGGFTYAVVLVAVVLVGIFAGVANLSTSRRMQADREAELLFRGQAYRSAIARYHAVNGRYPRDLRELLQGSSLVPQRYLRSLYPDPMAERAVQAQAAGGWRLLRAPDGGVAGVASQSRQTPLKQANFPPGLEKLEGAQSYREWSFDHTPRAVRPAAARPDVAAAPGRR